MVRGVSSNVLECVADAISNEQKVKIFGVDRLFDCELPKTASPLPLAAIGGLTSLLLGLGLGVIRRRMQ